MQISRTTLSNINPKVDQATQFKPLGEKWTVGDKTFSSTSDLLENVEHHDQIQATYHYQDQDSVAPYTLTEKLRNAAGTSMFSAGAGAAVGALASGGLVILDGMVGLLGTVMMSPTRGLPSSLILAPIAVGAAIGAVVGAGSGYALVANSEMQTATGVLSAKDGATSFFLGGDVTQKVDLEAFNQAPTPAISPEENPEGSQIGTRLGAAAIGAALAPLSAVPILGQLAPPVAGAVIGSALDRRTALGTGLGVMAGVGVTAASVTALGASSNVPLAAVAGTLALGGAILGKKIYEASSAVPATRKYGNQWWNQQAKELEPYEMG